MAALPAPRILRRPRIVPQKKDHQHAWSVAVFESERPHLTTFVRENLLSLLDDEECSRVLIRAPVKSGKREFAEYLAQRDHSIHSGRVHAFLSAWHRAADLNQRKELELHPYRRGKEGGSSSGRVRLWSRRPTNHGSRLHPLPRK